MATVAVAFTIVSFFVFIGGFGVTLLGSSGALGETLLDGVRVR